MNNQTLKSQNILIVVQALFLLFITLINKNNLHSNLFIKSILLFIVLPITLYNLVYATKNLISTVKRVARKYKIKEN